MVNVEFIRFTEIEIVFTAIYFGLGAILFIGSKVEILLSLVGGAAVVRHVTETAGRTDPDSLPAKPSTGLR